MYIDYISITFFVIAFFLMAMNIALMISIKKGLKENLIDQTFSLLKEEISLLERRQADIQSKSDDEAKRLDTIEKVLSTIIISNGSYGPDDGGSILH
jgi:dsDNA-specific endonuclease/ATPase MutS2